MATEQRKRRKITSPASCGLRPKQTLPFSLLPPEVTLQILRYTFVVGLGLDDAGKAAYIHVSGSSVAYEETPVKALYGYFKRDRARYQWAIVNQLYAVDWQRASLCPGVGRYKPVWFVAPPLSVRVLRMGEQSSRMITLPLPRNPVGIPGDVRRCTAIRGVYTSIFNLHHVKLFGADLQHVESITADDLFIYTVPIEITGDHSLRFLKIVVYNFANMAIFGKNLEQILTRIGRITELRFVLSSSLIGKNRAVAAHGLFKLLEFIVSLPGVKFTRFNILEVPGMSIGLLDRLISSGRRIGQGRLQELRVQYWYIYSRSPVRIAPIRLNVDRFYAPHKIQRSAQCPTAVRNKVTFSFVGNVTLLSVRENGIWTGEERSAARWTVEYVFDPDVQVHVLSVDCGPTLNTVINLNKKKKPDFYTSDEEMAAWRTRPPAKVDKLMIGGRNPRGSTKIQKIKTLTELHLLYVDHSITHADLLLAVLGDGFVGTQHLRLDATSGAGVNVKGIIHVQFGHIWTYADGVERVTMDHTNVADAEFPDTVRRLDFVGSRAYPLNFLLPNGIARLTELRLENASLNMSMPLPDRQSLDLRKFDNLDTIHYDYASPVFDFVEMKVTRSPEKISVLTLFAIGEIVGTANDTNYIRLYKVPIPKIVYKVPFNRLPFIGRRMVAAWTALHPDVAIRLGKLVSKVIFSQIPFRYRTMVSPTLEVFDRLIQSCKKDKEFKGDYDVIENAPGLDSALYCQLALVLFGPVDLTRELYKDYVRSNRSVDLRFDVLNDQYCVPDSRRVLGSGSYGIVKEGIDIHNWYPIVAKADTSDDFNLRRSVKEYNIMRVLTDALECPRVVVPLDVCAFVKHYNRDQFVDQLVSVWFVMELGLDNANHNILQWLDEKRGGLKSERGRRMKELWFAEAMTKIYKCIYDVSLALECMHRAKCYHCDLKLANVIYMGMPRSPQTGKLERRYKLTDFGASYVRQMVGDPLQTRLEDIDVSRERGMRGTFGCPYDTPPNQDGYLDIYAIGVIITVFLRNMVDVFVGLPPVDYHILSRCSERFIDKIKEVAINDREVSRIIKLDARGWFNENIGLAGWPAWTTKSRMTYDRKLGLEMHDGKYMLKMVWYPVVNERFNLLGRGIEDIRALMMQCLLTDIPIQRIRDSTQKGYHQWKAREEYLLNNT